MSIWTKLFGTHSEHEIKRIMPIVEKINALEPRFKEYSDQQLAEMTNEFKGRLAKGETLDDILPEAYAVVREAAVRTLGQRAFDVQLIGAIILHQGRIAEMKTGEGKTLTSVFPVYLNALEGQGVHVVTVNDYLAKRDSEWMGQIYRSLGLSVGCILNSLDSDERRVAYGCDITYGTNNEFGFDYLRDNMVVYKDKLVMRGLHFAIIDEVDSILIDEARTPLIISGQSGKSTKLYEVCDILARQLKRGEAKELSKMEVLMNEDAQETGDFIVNEKDKNVTLTEEGVKRVEQFFNIDNFSDPENLEIQHNIITALRANYLMFKDKDYVVKDDEIIIVDDFTGRLMPGRRYSDGLHQAIEAKEHVKVKRESKTLATITFQNYFNKYDKKAGMTGTALTEEQEFRDIYGMDVIEVPTNRPIARIDLDDAVYTTHREKLNAIVAEIKRAHATGQPILVGTITIEASEELSMLLKKNGVPDHKVLNAKFHELEAEIVAEAGQRGAVTIATNMAGRGTDIKLGPGVAELGGLKIIGTERHESRRIDNQLRGRAGRQGDPGESRFYISLEDDIMRLFGSERMMAVFKTLGVEEGQQIEHRMLSNAIERAQKKIESNNYSIRKSLLEYDRVNNEQREIIYGERRRVLEGESMRDTILKMISDTVENLVGTAISEDQDPEDWDMTELNELLVPVFPFAPITLTEDQKSKYKRATLIQQLKEQAVAAYEAKEAEFPVKETMREIERIIMLRAIDSNWMNHIDDMDQLRQGIGLQAYGQKDPVVEYRIQGFDMFDNMISNVQEDVVKMIMHIRLEQKLEREEVAKATGTNRDDTAVNAPKKRTSAKVYPNDPCPCGSGKKYKQCHGRIQ
ncbi:MAG: preprotein translocase subunit SecA [Lachnospiraceae bacterium]|nr:preprotein translocase subunit SecA [Lachnospiraceae bacterium]